MLRKYCFPIIISLIFGISGCDSYEDMPAEETLDSWQTFNKSNGLVSDSISCLHADRQGRLWAGTFSEGLMMFDGRTWTHFTTSHGLPSNFITDVYQYNSGEIWVSTRKGLAVSDGAGFTKFAYLGDLWITKIQPSFNGNVWLGTQYFGLIELTGGIEYNSIYSESNPGLNGINAVDQASDGTIWAGTDGGAYRITDNDTIIYTREDGLPSDTVSAVLCDNWGDIWLGNYYGRNIVRIDYQFREINLYHNSQYSGVSTIINDRKGHIWIGTGGEGAVYFDGITMRSYSVSDGLPGITIIDIDVDDQGAVWFGSLSDGIAKYQPPLMMNQ